MIITERMGRMELLLLGAISLSACSYRLEVSTIEGREFRTDRVTELSIGTPASELEARLGEPVSKRTGLRADQEVWRYYWRGQRIETRRFLGVLPIGKTTAGELVRDLRVTVVGGHVQGLSWVNDRRAGTPP